MKDLCEYTKCEKIQYSGGLCSAHYQQKRKGLELKPLNMKHAPNKIKKGEPCPGPAFFDTDIICGRPVYAGGLCRGHRAQKERFGSLKPLASNAKGLLTVEQRFFRKIIKNLETNCWIWTGAKRNKHGVYGTFEHTSAHRWSYQHFNKVILKKEETLDHLCRNTLCCNPEHLEPVTMRENVKRMHAYWDLVRQLEKAEARILELETLLSEK